MALPFLFTSRSIRVARPDADYAIFETEINRCRGEENRLVQLRLSKNPRKMFLRFVSS